MMDTCQIPEALPSTKKVELSEMSEKKKNEPPDQLYFIHLLW